MNVKYYKFTESELITKWILLDDTHPLKWLSPTDFVREVKAGKITHMGKPIKIKSNPPLSGETL